MLGKYRHKYQLNVVAFCFPFCLSLLFWILSFSFLYDGVALLKWCETRKKKEEYSSFNYSLIRESPLPRKDRLIALLKKPSLSRDFNPWCSERLLSLYRLCHHHCLFAVLGSRKKSEKDGESHFLRKQRHLSSRLTQKSFHFSQPSSIFSLAHQSGTDPMNTCSLVTTITSDFPGWGALLRFDGTSKLVNFGKVISRLVKFCSKEICTSLPELPNCKNLFAIST